MGQSEHFGGAAGNSSVNLNLTLKYPPSYGVPSKWRDEPQHSGGWEMSSATRDVAGFLITPKRTWSLNNTRNVEHVLLVCSYSDTFRRLCLQLLDLAHQATKRNTGNSLRMAADISLWCRYSYDRGRLTIMRRERGERWGLALGEGVLLVNKTIALPPGPHAPPLPNERHQAA